MLEVLLYSDKCWCLLWNVPRIHIIEWWTSYGSVTFYATYCSQILQAVLLTTSKIALIFFSVHWVVQCRKIHRAWASSAPILSSPLQSLTIPFLLNSLRSLGPSSRNALTQKSTLIFAVHFQYALLNNVNCHSSKMSLEVAKIASYLFITRN